VTAVLGSLHDNFSDVAIASSTREAVKHLTSIKRLAPVANAAALFLLLVIDSVEPVRI
jgi:hypothetical protein